MYMSAVYIYIYIYRCFSGSAQARACSRGAYCGSTYTCDSALRFRVSSLKFSSIEILFWGSMFRELLSHDSEAFPGSGVPVAHIDPVGGLRLIETLCS